MTRGCPPCSRSRVAWRARATLRPSSRALVMARISISWQTPSDRWQSAAASWLTSRCCIGLWSAALLGPSGPKPARRYARAWSWTRAWWSVVERCHPRVVAGRCQPPCCGMPFASVPRRFRRPCGRSWCVGQRGAQPKTARLWTTSPCSAIWRPPALRAWSQWPECLPKARHQRDHCIRQHLATTTGPLSSFRSQTRFTCRWWR
mmetsp:Transcript_100553/g.283587  ORF Transcript_100553/g.283587 Transcript_100553/m.283587 type:complete len:204 (+) Transcript_100553:2294-2905(+)